jgi:hypothetical protein
MSLSPVAERLLQKGAVTVLRKRTLRAAADLSASSSIPSLLDPTPKKWQSKIPKKVKRAKDPKEKYVSSPILDSVDSTLPFLQFSLVYFNCHY